MQTRHDSETLIGSTGLIVGESRPVPARWLKEYMNKSSWDRVTKSLLID